MTKLLFGISIAVFCSLALCLLLFAQAPSAESPSKAFERHYLTNMEGAVTYDGAGRNRKVYSDEVIVYESRFQPTDSTNWIHNTNMVFTGRTFMQAEEVEEITTNATVPIGIKWKKSLQPARMISQPPPLPR